MADKKLPAAAAGSVLTTGSGKANLHMTQSQLTAVSEAQRIDGLLQWKIGFKSPNFHLNSESLLVFFDWSKMAQGSFGLPVLDSESVRV